MWHVLTWKESTWYLSLTSVALRMSVSLFDAQGNRPSLCPAVKLGARVAQQSVELA